MKPIGASFTHRWIAQLRQMHDYRIEGYLATIEFLNDVIIKSDVRIAEAVKNNHDALLLKSIPGVGDYTALIIASAIDGIERFRSSGKALSICRACPIRTVLCRHCTSWPHNQKRRQHIQMDSCGMCIFACKICTSF